MGDEELRLRAAPYEAMLKAEEAYNTLKERKRLADIRKETEERSTLSWFFCPTPGSGGGDLAPCPCLAIFWFVLLIGIMSFAIWGSWTTSDTC